MFDYDTYIGRVLTFIVLIVVVLAAVIPLAALCAWIAAHYGMIAALMFMTLVCSLGLAAVTMWLD